MLEREEGLVLQLRRKRQLGLKRLRIDLIRYHGFRFSLNTLPKAPVRYGLNRQQRPKLKRKGTKGCSRPVPGDRVQLDTGKIVPGLYQDTATDASRGQVLVLYPDRSAAGTLDFLERVRAGMPFPVQWVQTERGGEFLACEIQNRLHDWCRRAAVSPRRWPSARPARGEPRRFT